jgi:RNA polymerase sigma factor (sigma-70 family)
MTYPICFNRHMDHKNRVRWFAREVLPHESDLRHWLSRRSRAGLPCDVDDIIQEAYARLWTTDLDAIRNPRAYLFVTARRILGDVIRRAQVVQIELAADFEELDVLEDADAGLEGRLSARQEVERLQRVVASLPSKCRQAFQLKKLEGLSQRETAERMGVAESTVEKHLAKAFRMVSEAIKAAANENTGPVAWYDWRQRARKRH